MSEHPISGLMGITMEKIREMVDVDTVIGDPITVSDGTVIIPVSKVSFGFASGGSDLPSKTQNELFGGGSGAGITIQPLAFLVVSKGEVKLLQMSMNANSSNAIINMVPEVFDKISSMIKKDEKENKK
ncbi:MAG TPA: GerW family sporulation protein [Oscillospiraceae bacterium]|nr:GerW family sporulation protein [Oscillospiraceae bacterium]